MVVVVVVIFVITVCVVAVAARLTVLYLTGFDLGAVWAMMWN